MNRGRLRGLLGAGLAGLILVVAAGAFIFREDIVRTWLDPKQPFQTYRPPAAPDYRRRADWALLPADPGLWSPSDPAADIFFVHPTTFNGGKDWNGKIGGRRGERFLQDVVLPNYAGPYQRVGRVFAPRYRQASLYAFMTNREDAQDARRFAYQDVRAAFRYFLDHYNDGRPIVLVGVEQGAGLAALLLKEVIDPDPALRARLVSAVLIDVVAPADAYGSGAPTPACTDPAAPNCVMAWDTAADMRDAERKRRRALVWGPDGTLQDLGPREPLCVDPLLGRTGDAPAPPRLDLGSTNATGLEWGARPAFLPRAVGAQCVDGFLRVSTPTSPSLRRQGGWIDRLKAAPYNLFYANEEADAARRLKTLTGRPGYRAPSAPSGEVISVVHAPIHRAD